MSNPGCNPGCIPGLMIGDWNLPWSLFLKKREEMSIVVIFCELGAYFLYSEYMSFIYRRIVHVLLYSVAFWGLSAHLMTEYFSISPATNFTFLSVGLVFAIVNGIFKPIVKLISLPLRMLTFGLFGIVINAGLLFLVQQISGGIDGGIVMTFSAWWVYAVVGVVMAIVTAIIP